MVSFIEESKSLCPVLREDAFISPDKLHLTVCMLKLESKEAVGEVASCLNGVFSEAIQISLKGVSIMKGSAKKCQVLYTNVVPNKHLQALGKEIVRRLAVKGLIYDFRPIKWHATLINSKYSHQAIYTFDATKIIEAFDNADFGRTTVTSMQLSKLKSIDSNSGYYSSDCTWNLK